ncbi:ATP10 protein-domain-containing protein [Boeremia exigua]|uniref:ATP10 protein-domain-containing protein n=1 Tax=Boeremia exigua TaxID=749465 RepID=UPI001E8CE8FA|nr:ATP10 protein-domain-containing protein [Boeremia exigua]KAH6615312.1 ATP10 protein-domain-containing protein [Boeremia exigua]
MLQPRISAPLRRVLVNPAIVCLRCETRSAFRPFADQFSRSLTTSRDPKQSAKPTAPPPTKSQSPPPTKEDDVFVPKPLGRPIGFPDPPQAGENTDIIKVKRDYKGMTMSQRNLAKRTELVEKWGTNYFRDFKNIRKYRSGKTFMANPRVFKAEAALYFPNLHGETLAAPHADTTDVLQGKVTVVNVYSSQWGETQARSFTGVKENPELQEILNANQGVAQMVDVNIEENSLKAWIIALFKWQLKAKRKQEEWGRYFVVRKGVSEKIRETIGLLNGRVGYVYIVDEECRIRWAGSGDAEGTEMQDMNKGFKKLIEARKTLV